MTSDHATPEPEAGPPFPDRPDDFPEWVYQLEREIQVGRAARLGIGFRRRARRLAGGLSALLVLGLLAYAGTVAYRYAQRREESSTASPASGVRTTASASPTPIAGPFDGTPAATFPVGAAGIVLPPAKRTGDFTAKQVAAGLAKVRTALVTARLDRAFMTAKDPERLARQFAPDARAGVRKDFTTETVASYATRLAPGARLTADQPRVKGDVHYRASRDATGIRVLEVTTNFVWVYAFQDAGPAPADGVVVLHDTVVWHVTHPDDVTPGGRGLWLYQMQSYGWNLDCLTIRQGLVKPGGFNPAAEPFTEDPAKLYDPDHPIAVPNAC